MYEGAYIPPEKEGEKGLFVHGIEHGLEEGDDVIDITAQKNGWPDVRGKIVKIDGTNIKVIYESGNERWKMNISLKKAE